MRITRINIILAIALLISTVLVGTMRGLGVFNPWLDVTEDGYGGIDDIVAVAEHFGESGTPIDRSELMLELQTAHVHNEAYSETTETRSGYDWVWQDLPAMNVQVTPQTNCILVITFSAEAITSTSFLEIYVRALVDLTPANPPSGVTLTKLTDWATHSYTFYAPANAGAHTVKIQWSYNDEVGSVQIRDRTLIVTALLP